MRGAALLMALAVAGCLEAPAATLPAAEAPALLSWSYACPGGAAAGDPCRIRLENSTETLYHPILATDPDDPTRLAMAAGAASGTLSLGPLALVPWLLAGPLGRPQDHALQTRIFLSSDSGATWSAAPAPPAALGAGRPGQIHLQATIALAQAAGGTLHAVSFEAWSTPDGSEATAVVHHAVFSGGAWRAPTVLGDAGNDAALLATGDEVLVAVTGRDGVRIHRSADAGTTWDVLGAPASEGCRSLAGFLARPDGPILACYGQEAPARLLRLAAEGIVEVGRLEQGFWSLRLADDGERFVLLGDGTSQGGNYSLLLATSPDGVNWSAPRDLRGDLPLGEAWGWGRLGPVAAARAHVHLLLQQGPQTDGLVGLRRTEAVAHAVLDAGTGTFLEGRELAAARGESGRSLFPLGADLQAPASILATPYGVVYAYGFARGIEVGAVVAG